MNFVEVKIAKSGDSLFINVDQVSTVTSNDDGTSTIAMAGDPEAWEIAMPAEKFIQEARRRALT